MRFKSIKPFICELVIMVVAVIVTFLGLTTTDFIMITFRLNFLMIALIIIALVLFISLFSRVVNLGVRALFDFIFQRVIEDRYLFLKEVPYKASVFSERFGRNQERSIGMYYLIEAQKGDAIHTFISPVFFNLTESKIYLFKIASSSHIILSFVDESDTATSTE